MVVASVGIFCNLGSFFILGAKGMRNSFNLLLMALGFFDTGYLIGAILEAVRKSFKTMTLAHLYLFPWLLYPGQAIMMTASIVMTVAIADDRYKAVHQPTSYYLVSRKQ